MKIITINCTNEYSTGDIINSIEEFGMRYKENVEFIRFYECGKKSKKQNEFRMHGWLGYRLCYYWSFICGYQYGVGTFSTKILCNKINKINPDIVHIHCPNSKSINLYYLLYFLKKKKFKTIITNHAEFFYTGNCSYAGDCTQYLNGCKKCKDYKNKTGSWIFDRTENAWKRMKNSFEGFDNLTMVAVSPWQEKRMNSSTIAAKINSVLIINGISDFFYDRGETEIAKHYKDKKNIVHVTSVFSDMESDIKGGKYLLDLAERLPEYNFHVIGTVGRIQCKLPPNVFLKGYISDKELIAEYYSMADLVVMTSKRETFGLTCAEALFCGTPVVGFKNGGSESIAIPEYSQFVQYGNVDSLCDVIEKWIDKKKYYKENIVKQAKERYSYQVMGKKYFDLYYKLIQENIE